MRSRLVEGFVASEFYKESISYSELKSRIEEYLAYLCKNDYELYTSISYADYLSLAIDVYYKN
jgi:hypothetical protein